MDAWHERELFDETQLCFYSIHPIRTVGILNEGLGSVTDSIRLSKQKVNSNKTEVLRLGGVTDVEFGGSHVLDAGVGWGTITPLLKDQVCSLTHLLNLAVYF